MKIREMIEKKDKRKRREIKGKRGIKKKEE